MFFCSLFFFGLFLFLSIGFLVDPDSPMIWRGPMATQALDQILRQTRWKDLDYLIVDMPPGTGDIQLTLSQRVPLRGAVIVTTPQDVALLDAKKGLKMFEKVGVPILGLIENMAIYHCPNCGHEEHIFGAEGGQKMAESVFENFGLGFRETHTLCGFKGQCVRSRPDAFESVNLFAHLDHSEKRGCALG